MYDVDAVCRRQPENDYHLTTAWPCKENFLVV